MLSVSDYRKQTPEKYQGDSEGSVAEKWAIHLLRDQGTAEPPAPGFPGVQAS